MFRTTLYKIKKSWTQALPSRHLRFCSKNLRCTPAGTQKLPTCVLQKEKSTDVTRDGNENCICGHCLGQHFHCNCDKCLRTLDRALGPHCPYKNSSCKCIYRGQRKKHLQNSNHRQIEDRRYGKIQEDDINTETKNNTSCNENVAFIEIDEIFDKDTQTKVNVEQNISAKQCKMNANHCNNRDHSQGKTTQNHLDSWTNKINKLKSTRNSDVYLNFNKNINKDTVSDLDELAIRCLDSPHCEIDQRLLKEMSIKNIAKDKLRSKYKVDAVQSDKTVQPKEPEEIKETQLYNKNKKAKSKSCAKNIAKHENVSILTHHAYYKKPSVYNKYYIKDNENKNENIRKERDVTYGEHIQSSNKDSKTKIETKLNQNSYYTYYRKPEVNNFKEYYVHENRNVPKREVREKTNSELLLACTVSEAEIETFFKTSKLNPSSYNTYYKKREVSNFKDYYLKGNGCKNKTINESKEERETRDVSEVANDNSYPSCIPTGYQNSLKVIPSEVEKGLSEEKLEPPGRPACLSPDLVTGNENKRNAIDDGIIEAVTVHVVKTLKIDSLSTLDSENSNGGQSGAVTLKSSRATKPLSELLQKVRKQNRMTYGKEVNTNGRRFCCKKQGLFKDELDEAVGTCQPQCPPPPPKPCPPPKPKCPPPPPSCPPPPPPPPCPPPTCPPPPCPPPPVCPPPPKKDPCKRICPILSSPHMFNEDKWFPKSTESF